MIFTLVYRTGYGDFQLPTLKRMREVASFPGLPRGEGRAPGLPRGEGRAERGYKCVRLHCMTELPVVSRRRLGQGDSHLSDSRCRMKVQCSLFVLYALLSCIAGERMDSSLFGTVFNMNCKNNKLRSIFVFTECQEVCDEEESLRLASGMGAVFAGRVEICHNRVWGTICADAVDKPWSEKNAQVVCRSLGYSGALNSILHNT